MADLDFAAGVDAKAFPEDVPVAGRCGDTDVLVVRTGGKICALSGSCTHLGAPLSDGIVIDGEIRCPWHHARFSLATGEAVGAPAFEGLTRFEVVEEDGRVFVGKPVRDGASSASGEAASEPIVIVGGGAAGHACAEMLSRSGAGKRVILLSAEADPPYDRTFCSKQYLAGKKERSDTALPATDVDLRTGVEVVGIDIEGRSVATADGERIVYDSLVLATGASPVVPDFEGNDRDDMFVVRTLADADALIAAAGKAQSAVVVGSSYIGLEVAGSLVQRGVDVTVVAEDSVPLGGTAGPEVGRFVQSLHEAKGVGFRLERQVTRWDGESVTLDDGSVLRADLLVAGTGVKPRIELAKRAGLVLASQEEGGGVTVDATLRTSAPHVYAIGDMASYPDPRLGHPIRVEHWVVAQRMGQWLARHLLGTGSPTYEDLPFFWSGHYDTSLRYVGHAASTDDRVIDGDIADKDFAVTFAEDGTPRAMLSCGRDVQSLRTEAAWEQ